VNALINNGTGLAALEDDNPASVAQLKSIKSLITSSTTNKAEAKVCLCRCQCMSAARWMDG